MEYKAGTKVKIIDNFSPFYNMTGTVVGDYLLKDQSAVSIGDNEEWFTMDNNLLVKADEINNTVLYGKPVADYIKNNIAETLQFSDKTYKLHILRVGHDNASTVYVNNKIKVAQELGIKVSANVWSEEDATNEKLEKVIKDSYADGIIVQLPLPKHLDTQKIINSIPDNKDVDGLKVSNIGKLFSNRKAELSPCTAKGIMTMLDYYKIHIQGKKVCIIGRSDLVGKPLISLMLNKNATVVSCNSYTPDKTLRQEIKSADIVISAIGKAKKFNHTYFKDGQVIIDIGINRDENGKLCGDVDFHDVISSFNNISITPVPKGVGLLTTATLMENVIVAGDLNGNK